MTFLMPATTTPCRNGTPASRSTRVTLLMCCEKLRRSGFSSGPPSLLLTPTTSLPFASRHVDEDRWPPDGKGRAEHDHVTHANVGGNFCGEQLKDQPVDTQFRSFPARVRLETSDHGLITLTGGRAHVANANAPLNKYRIDMDAPHVAVSHRFHSSYTSPLCLAHPTSGIARPLAEHLRATLRWSS